MNKRAKLKVIYVRIVGIGMSDEIKTAQINKQKTHIHPHINVQLRIGKQSATIGGNNIQTDKAREKKEI